MTARRWDRNLWRVLRTGFAPAELLGGYSWWFGGLGGVLLSRDCRQCATWQFMDSAQAEAVGADLYTVMG